MRHRYASRPVARPVFVPPADIAVIRRIVRQNALDPRLEPTDRHMQRWAATGDGEGPTGNHPWEDGSKASRPPPLAISDAAIVDQILADTPDHWQRFVYLWYMSSVPVQQIADRIGVHRQRVYEERRLVLAYLYGRLRHSGMRIASYRFR